MTFAAISISTALFSLFFVPDRLVAEEEEEEEEEEG